MKLPILYKRDVLGKILTWTVEVDQDKYRTISGYIDGVQSTSEWTTCYAKNIGKKNETTPDQQALLEAQAMHKKKKEGGRFENIEDVDNPIFFKPMLANKWEDRQDKVTYPLFSQPKLDGIRCIVRADGMWSRNGKPIISAPHIFRSIQHLFEENPDLVLDGELYADKFANDFNKICSLVKKTKPTMADLAESAKSIEYHIYDIPSVDDVFLKRFEILSELFRNDDGINESCVLVKTSVVGSLISVQSLYEQYVDEGYEGQMLRTNEKYESKRSNTLLKHKSFIDEEYTILDVHEGKGDREGMVGHMVFANKEGRTFHSNVKANWEELTEMWKDRHSLVGKQATIKYFNLTPDNIPRFPYVIAIRDYE
jgi:DNA ligase-1